MMRFMFLQEETGMVSVSLIQGEDKQTRANQEVGFHMTQVLLTP